MGDFGDSVRKLLMAGIGAAAITVEKAKDMIDSLSAKGEVVAAQGKAASDEMMGRVSARIERIAEQIRERLSGADEFEELLSQVADMSAEQRAALLFKISEADAAEDCERCDCACGDCLADELGGDRGGERAEECDCGCGEGE